MVSHMPHATVVVAEDEPHLRELIAMLLESEGYQVLSASNGDQALELLMGEAKRADLLLTDIRMPGTLSGLRLAKRARTLNPGLKMILMSGNPTQDDAPPEDFPFLQKPFMFEQLVMMIDTVMRSPPN